MNTPTIESELLPSDSEFDRMKTELFARIEETDTQLRPHLVPLTRKRKRPHRRVIWASMSGAVAVALTVALVATNVLGPHAATAQAAEVLHSAAAATITSSDPVVGPGQYLKIETTEAGLGFSGQNSAFEQPQTVTIYIPYDRSGKWVLARQWLPPGKSYGDAKAAIKDFWSDPDQGKLRLYQGAGGNFGMYQTPDPAEIAKLPRNADALLKYLYDHAEGSHSKDEAVFTRIEDLLSTGMVPADLRSAMYQALAKVPGVYLAQKQANLDGRTGVAIGRHEPSRPFIEQIIIDPTNGLLIGVRQVATQKQGPVPVGAMDDWSAVTTTVVDHAPSGPYAQMRPAG